MAIGQKKRVKRVIALVLAAAALAGAGFGVKALFFSKPERVILTEKTSFGSLATTVEGTGTAFPGNSSTISAASSASKVTAVYVSAGDTVAVGDPLYDQDDSEVDDQLDELQKQVDELYDQIDSYNEQIDNSSSQIADYQEQIADLRATISSLSVSSPMSGRVIALHVTEEQNAQKGGQLVTVVDDSQMTLTEYFSYAYEDQITLGMEAGLSVASLSLNLTGKVTDIDKVERLTGQGTRCFAVTITVSNPGALTEGMTGAGWLLTAEGQKLYPAIEGKLEYGKRKTVTAPAAGEVLSVAVSPYQKVSAGELLMTLDASTYEDQIKTLEKNIRTAQSSIERTQNSISNTRDRIATYQERITETEESRADYHVVSDIAGTVIMVNVRAGETPRQGMTAVSIYNQDVMTITANIDEEDIGSIQKGMEVSITATGGRYTGTVTEISYEATNSNGVAYFPITVEIPSNGALSAGVNVSWSIALGDAQEGVLVPLAALKTTDQGTCVFLKADARPENAIDLKDVDIPDGFYAIPVEVETVSSRYARIRGGLAEGAELFTRYENAAPSGGDTTSKNQDGDDQEFSFPGGDFGGGMPNFSGGGGSGNRNRPSFSGGMPGGGPR